MTGIPVPIKSLPGIKRDGTELEGQNYVDGQWVRFQRGLPRKIGGYQNISPELPDVARSIHLQTKNRQDYIHLGSPGKMTRVLFPIDSQSSTMVDRTPVDVVRDRNNYWSMDVMFDPASNKNLILALLTNGCPCSTDTPGKYYYGDLYGTEPLTLVPTVTASSGILALPPFMIAYGSDGFIQWSNLNAPTDFIPVAPSDAAGEARITAQKILKALPLRGGGGYTPAMLIWSVDSLLRGMYTGGTTQWEWDTLSGQISVLSPTSIIENDGIFYWAAGNRFLMFNGVVREIPNQLNVNWFFDNVNYGTRCFAVKNPRWGEIWWCYPVGDESECTRAVIYNYREELWYDTELPNGGRGAGVHDVGTGSIMMCSNVADEGGAYDLWLHEVGVDEVDEDRTRAVRSYFETSDIFLGDTEKPSDSGVSIDLLEPDFVQSGDMTVYVKTRANARAPFVVQESAVFEESPEDTYNQVVPLKTTGRQMRLRFESNVIGGDYQMGQVMAHLSPSIAKVL